MEMKASFSVAFCFYAKVYKIVNTPPAHQSDKSTIFLVVTPFSVSNV